MKNTGTVFNVGPGHGELPRLVHAMSTIIDSPSYHHRGTTRSDLNYCFQYSVSGTGMLRYGSKLYKLEPGSAFFSRISDPALEYFYPEDGSKPWKFFWCAIEGDTFYTMAEEICRKFGHFYEIPFNTPIISELYEYGRQPLNTRSIDNTDNARLAMELLTALTVNGKEAMVTSEDSLIDRALQFIQLHIDKNINASDVARAMGVSREHLSRIFQSRLQKAPFKVITDQKMNLASTYLKETSLSIKEVAKVVGIPSYNFSSWFSKNRGMTPKAFRKGV